VKVFGLTGGIASGKSAVAKLLAEAGLDVIDADVLAREVVAKGSPGLSAIVEAFGAHLLQEDGTLDRAALGERIFSDPEARSVLEGITHPRIGLLAAQRFADLDGKGREVAIYEVPLLFENNLDKMMAGTLLVACPESMQVQRMMARDGLDEGSARARIAAQMPLAEKRQRATVVLENDSSLDTLPEKLSVAWRELTGEALLRPSPAS
jgi:dephospho-CoA kinase